MKTTQMRLELAQLGSGAHALAIQIMGNPDDAADAVQDALTKALEQPRSYDSSRGPLKTWFLRVVRNRCIDLIRKRKPHDEKVEQLVDSGIGPEQAAENADVSRMLERALAAIDPDHRQIVILRDYLELPYKEIATVLEVAPGTVMSRLHRARLALAKVYREYDE